MFADQDDSVGPVRAFGPQCDYSRGHGFSMDGAMGRRQDVSEYQPDMAIWRNIWSDVVRFSRKPVFPATGCLGSFGGLARICVIDLCAGVSTAPVEMIVDFNQMDFPKLQFPPVVVEVLPSTSVTLASADSQGRGCPGNGHSPGDGFMTNLGFPQASCTPGEMYAAELNSPRARDVRKDWTI